MDNNNNNNINNKNNNNQSSLPQPSAPPPDPSVTPPPYQPSSSSPNSQLQQPQPQLVTPQLPSQQQQEEEDEPSTLRVPTTTPQQRRKRGLSLRSQLFNKAFNLQSTSPSPSPPPPPTVQPPSPLPQTQSPPPVDVNELNQGNIELLNLKKPAPTINVTEATPRESTGTYPSFNPNLATSTTHLTAISSTQTDASSAGASFISKRERQQFLRYKTHSKTLQTFIDFKNRLLGINNLPPTIAGRVIPLSINHKSINEYFQDNYYDEKHDSLIDERCNKPYINNTITSSKYTVYDFLPKQLKAQFSKIANCYFMVVAIMQMIPGWSTTGQYTTIIPLCIFMSISIAREGFDDWKRHGHDKEENNKRTTILKEDQELGQFDTHSITTIMTDSSNDPAYSPPSSTSSGSSGESTDPKMAYTDPNALKRYNLKEYNTTWHEVKVGDIVKINENEWFPADVLLISTSDLDTQIAYVETMALDGETNLKPKYPHTELAKLATNVTSLKNLKTLITTEDPNIDLYNFEGSFQLNDETYSLGPDNIVYRGSILRNTKSVLGLVVFTGEETKIRMNNIKHPRTKAPKLQKNINYIVMFMVLVVILLSCFSTMAQRLAYQRNRDRAWYLFEQDAGVAATMMGFIIMYNTLIPLSLYVTMEIIKVMQLCFLQFDIDMYHVESNTPADAKTATILEELGQVSYIFSDKTGTLTDNKMVFRKFSVCGVSWLHDLDLMADERANPNSFATAPLVPRISMHAPQSPRIQPQSRQSRGSADYVPRTSTTSIVRNSMDVQSMHTTWTSLAHPNKVQNLSNSLQLLRHIQSHPQTLFAKRAKFFLLSIALCNTCLPRKQQSTSSKKKGKPSEPNGITPDNSSGESSETMEDEDISYQAASPDELALVQAARDLGYVVFDRQNNRLIIRTYPDGFDKPAKLEEYTVLEVIEFTSSRKRMSIVVKFPDGRIGIVCKGADSIILERLKNSKIAQEKAREISIQSSERKTQEADVILNSRKSYSVDVMTGHTPRKPSIRQSLSALMVPRTSSARLRKMSSIDNALMGTEEEEIADIANRARKSLHLQQLKKYSLDVYENDPIAGSAATTTVPISPVRSYSDYSVPLDGPSENAQYVPNDKLLVNDEFIIEKTLEHLEEFSTEGLRTLLYSFKWLDKQEYETWSTEYHNAKISLTNRAQLVEQVGGKIEHGLDLIGATAIEDKLQDGVSEAIDKLRRAGIKLWMLTGDKRETAINIGYSCRLIKDYSTVVILSNHEGKDALMDRITSATLEIEADRVAHCVLVIDGGTLADVENDSTLLTAFLELCILVDSTICCRASPSQKANMVSAIRNLQKNAVTLAIGDGANDIAMIQSADIGVGITGKEGLQAARSADYAIAQFRFLLKLLLVNGRYNYIRTSKFVLCTFYKELLFYLTQCIYQRNTLFSGSSLYESWSLSMFNTLFTSLPVICIGMFDKDLKPATLLAVPELYSKGRLYQAFNLRVFISWMVLATLQSVGISFLLYYVWGFTALRDNTTFALGSMSFATLVIVINAKCTLIEMQNRNWLAFASFIISVGGFGLWNILIMLLYRTKQSPIYFVAYGLYTWGRDQSWWAALLVLFTIPLLFDILIKIAKFMFRPNDDEIFRVYEKDIELRIYFEQIAYNDLKQSWTFPKEPSTTYKLIKKVFRTIFCLGKESPVMPPPQHPDLSSINSQNEEEEDNYSEMQSAVHRKRAGTNPMPTELPPSGEGSAIAWSSSDYKPHVTIVEDGYEVLPSGKRVRIKTGSSKWNSFSQAFKRDNEDVNAIIDARLRNLGEDGRVIETTTETPAAPHHGILKKS